MKRKKPLQRFVSNANTLCDVIIERGLTASQVSELIGLAPATVTALLKEDKPVRLATAAALRKNFGTDVVRLVHGATPTAE